MANISLSVISECTLNFDSCDYSHFPPKKQSHHVIFIQQWMALFETCLIYPVHVFVFSGSVTQRLFDFSGCSGIKWPMFWSWAHKMEPPGCGRFPVGTVKHLKDMDRQQEVGVWCQTVSLICREWCRVYICRIVFFLKFLNEE